MDSEKEIWGEILFACVRWLPLSGKILWGICKVLSVPLAPGKTMGPSTNIWASSCVLKICWQSCHVTNCLHTVAGCRGINNSTLANVLPSCTETEHSQQEVLTLTQMSSPVTTDTDATQHPDTTRPGNDSQRADSAHKQLDRTSSPTRLHLSPLSAFLRRIARLTTQRELRTPRVPATQQQWPPASQLEARARSRDVPTATYVTHYGAHSLNPKTRALPHSSPFYQKGMSTIEMTTKE